VVLQTDEFELAHMVRGQNIVVLSRHAGKVGEAQLKPVRQVSLGRFLQSLA
jgi:hypothetical protein